MGSLMYLRASNAVYFEVGGTTTNIGVIKNGRPALTTPSSADTPPTSTRSTCAFSARPGGSMVRINDKEVVDVGPRSAHIAGCEYAAFTPEEEIVDPQVELIQPKKGDPDDYVVIRLASGKRITITNTCAANVLGLIEPQYFAHGNANSARKAMQPVADKLGITVEELARQILDKSFEKVNQCITELAEKYQLDHDQIKLVGCGGGAAALICYCAEKMDVPYSIPENAEVISSIGVALAMVRDVVERIVPNPTQKDIAELKKEAMDAAIGSALRLTPSRCTSRSTRRPVRSRPSPRARPRSRRPICWPSAPRKRPCSWPLTTSARRCPTSSWPRRARSSTSIRARAATGTRSASST